MTKTYVLATEFWYQPATLPTSDVTGWHEHTYRRVCVRLNMQAMAGRSRLTRSCAFLHHVCVSFISHCVLCHLHQWRLYVINTLSLYLSLTHCLSETQSNLKGSRPLTTHSTRSGRSSPVSIVLSQQRAYTPALQLGALNNVGCRLHLSSRLLPFASSPDGATTECGN